MLFQSEGSARVHKSFEDQFQPDGQDYLYRKSQKGAPIRVSASERDDFIAAFGWQWNVLVWGGAIGFALILVAVFVLIPGAMASEDLTIWSSMAVFIVFVVGSTFWIWNAPMRALRGRGFSGEPLSPQEARRLTFSKISYGQLLLVPVFAAFLLLRVSRREDIFSGWQRLWLVVAAALVLLAAVQAFRKWRFESRLDK